MDMELLNKKRAKSDESENSENHQEEDEDEKEYEVEKIVKKKFDKENEEILYFVKWVGYDSDQNTWEPLANLSGCLDLIAEYEASLCKGGKDKSNKPRGRKKAPSPSSSKERKNQTKKKDNDKDKKKKHKKEDSTSEYSVSEEVEESEEGADSSEVSKDKKKKLKKKASKNEDEEESLNLSLLEDSEKLKKKHNKREDKKEKNFSNKEQMILKKKKEDQAKNKDNDAKRKSFENPSEKKLKNISAEKRILDEQNRDLNIKKIADHANSKLNKQNEIRSSEDLKEKDKKKEKIKNKENTVFLEESSSNSNKSIKRVTKSDSLARDYSKKEKSDKNKKSFESPNSFLGGGSIQNKVMFSKKKEEEKCKSEKADKILNVRVNDNKEMLFKVNFVNEALAEGNSKRDISKYIPHSEIKEKYPYILLDFYETKLKFK